MTIPEFRRDAIKRAVTIHEALELVHVELSEGAQTQQVACPFHHDSHPSARIYDDHLFCFTCGRSWDAIGLVQESYGMSYLAAVEWLESEFHVTPLDADPAAVIRATLRAKPPVVVSTLMAHVETQLRAARARITCDQFARYTTALDAVQWQLDTQAVTPTEAAGVLTQLLVRVR